MSEEHCCNEECIAHLKWEVEELVTVRNELLHQIEQLEEANRKLEKALKHQKDQNKMLMEGRRGL